MNRPPHARTAGLVLGLLLATASAPVFAEPPQADDLVREGVQLRRRSQDAEALVLFRRAYDLSPTTRTRAQIGFAEQALGNWVEAEDDLARSMADSADAWVARNATVLATALQEVRSHLASLHIDTNVEGAELQVDGKMRAKLPIASDFRVEAGERTVAVHAAGYDTFEERIVLPAGAEIRETVTLHPTAPPPPSPSSSPVESAQQPPSPPPPTPQPPPHGPTEAPPVSVPLAPTVNLLPPKVDDGRTWTTVGLVLAGAGIVGIGVGATFGVIAMSDDNAAACNANNKCLPVPLDDAKRAAVASDVGLYAGGALFAAGATLILLHPPWAHRQGQPASRAAIVPLLSPAGFGVEGVW
jgi:hypothetical protein